MLIQGIMQTLAHLEASILRAQESWTKSGPYSPVAPPRHKSLLLLPTLEVAYVH